MGKEEQREPGAGRRLPWCPVGRGASGMSRGRAGYRGSADWRWSTQRERGSPEWVRSPGSVGRKEREGLGEGPSGRDGEGRGRLREWRICRVRAQACRKVGEAMVRAISVAMNKMQPDRA